MVKALFDPQRSKAAVLESRSTKSLQIVLALGLHLGALLPHRGHWLALGPPDNYTGATISDLLLRPPDFAARMVYW
jgi:hypothetical protein